MARLHRLVFVLTIAAAAVMSAACEDLLGGLFPTSPSVSNLGSLIGNWSPDSSQTASAESCSSLQWTITGVSGTTVTGRFHAVCAGTVTLDGTASGTPDGNKINWTATGDATTTGGLKCPFELGGTATPEGDTLRVVYSGKTCLGPVSGTQILKKK